MQVPVHRKAQLLADLADDLFGHIAFEFHRIEGAFPDAREQVKAHQAGQLRTELRGRRCGRLFYAPVLVYKCQE